jgi:hypothetical protein
MKKSLHILLLLGVLVLFNSQVSAQDSRNLDFDPNPVTVVADTTPAASFPYPTIFNFHYSTTYVPLINAGTVGAMYFNDKYYLNAWNSASLYRYNGEMGGPTTVADSMTYYGQIRDLTSDGTYLYGGRAAAAIYQMDANGALVSTITLPTGNVARTIAYTPEEDGFFISNFSDDIRLVSRAGAVVRTLTGTAAIAAKYGLAYSNVPGDVPALWAWGQGTLASPYNVLTKINPQTGAVLGTWQFGPLPIPSGATSPSGIAGGAEVCMINGNYVLLLNYQNYALAGYLLGTGSDPNVIFSDGFETYTAGQLLACQAPTLWTTWSNAACGSEDAEVSADFAYAGTRSVKVITDDDLIKKFGTSAYTSGKYKISFYVYIPSGKAGYWNTLASFAGSSSNWALEVYFDATGGGRINPGGAVPGTFQWTPNVWHKVEHFVDLDNNIGMFAFNNNVVHQQQYTLGAYTSAVPKTLDAVDFYGATANDVMYFDNFQIETINVVPVELTSFAATQQGSKITLNWTTATEVNNHGFEVERKIAESTDWTVIGFKQGFGTTTEARSYSFIDDISLISSDAVSYRLKQIDFDGRYEYSNEILVDNIVPTQFSVAQNYPNPFNPVTSIKYQLPAEKFVTLKVYNSLGEEVRTLVNNMVNAGSHEISFSADGLSSGVYFYILRAGQDEFVQTMKMILMK